MSTAAVPDGWEERYARILEEFGYDRQADAEAAAHLDSILDGSPSHTHYKRIGEIARGRNVAVIGSGPSLPRWVPELGSGGSMEKAAKIVADSALGPVLAAGVVPDIVITDLDGDKGDLESLSQTECVFVVHAHGDNREELQMAGMFKNCVGTTQGIPVGQVRNFGGFTDGDRGAFLASHFGARAIVLVGMDFGGRIGRHSNTKRRERGVKLQKLKKGESLLEWLSTFTGSALFTVSRPIGGFARITREEAAAMMAGVPSPPSPSLTSSAAPAGTAAT